MSMSCFVLSQRALATTDAWQRSLDELGFALRLDPGENDRAVAAWRDHLPAVWKGQEAGFECYPGGADDAADIAEGNADLEAGGPWAHAIEIVYWGHAGCAGAMMAAAAYARSVDGVLYEAEGGDIVRGEDLAAFGQRSAEEMWACLVRDGEA